MTDKLSKPTNDGRVKWFGESWGAPICDPADKVDVPTGRLCLMCDREILAGDQGLMVTHLGETANGAWRGAIRQPWHLDCWLMSVLPPECFKVRLVLPVPGGRQEPDGAA